VIDLHADWNGAVKVFVNDPVNVVATSTVSDHSVAASNLRGGPHKAVPDTHAAIQNALPERDGMLFTPTVVAADVAARLASDVASSFPRPRRHGR
jgi:hypothetical protein